MCVYAPTGLPAGRPLVVALHGCAQQAEDHAEGPGWTKDGIHLGDDPEDAKSWPVRCARRRSDAGADSSTPYQLFCLS
jgi:hypothetical protein